MRHPFSQLRADYEHLLSICHITRPVPVDEACHTIVKAGLDQYRHLEEATRIPALLIAAIDLREGDCNPRLGIGQGDPWNKVSTHVPRGKGPFGSRLEANLYYLRYDHLDSLGGLDPPTWTWAFCVYKSIGWNGWGPIAHGRHSGYPWSCTNIYDERTDGIPPGGKYVADGKWSPTEKDQQAGAIPVMLELARAYPDLLFAPLPTIVDTQAAPPPPELPTGFGGAPDEVEKLQDNLNHLVEAGVIHLDAPLQLDGNFGRRTREAVRALQEKAGLEVDGVVGPKTEEAIVQVLEDEKAHDR